MNKFQLTDKVKFGLGVIIMVVLLGLMFFVIGELMDLQSSQEIYELNELVLWMAEILPMLMGILCVITGLAIFTFIVWVVTERKNKDKNSLRRNDDEDIEIRIRSLQKQIDLQGTQIMLLNKRIDGLLKIINIDKKRK